MFPYCRLMNIEVSEVKQTLVPVLVHEMDTTESWPALSTFLPSWAPGVQFQVHARATHSRGRMLINVIVSQKQAVNVASSSSSAIWVLPQISNTARPKVAAGEWEHVTWQDSRG